MQEATKADTSVPDPIRNLFSKPAQISSGAHHHFSAPLVHPVPSSRDLAIVLLQPAEDNVPSSENVFPRLSAKPKTVVHA